MSEKSTDDERRRDSTVLTDRDDVRRWADENDVVPVRDSEAEGERRSDLVRRDEMRSHHEERQWDDFLDEFEDRELAVAYTDAGDAGSGRHRLVERTHVVDEHGEMDDSVVKDLLEGETVETEVTEREVVETEVVETATIESRLVDSEVVDSEIVDSEIVEEELVGIAVTEASDSEVVDDDRRYFDDDDQRIEIEERGAVVLEFDETRVETEEQIEKKIIESTVVEQDVDESTRVEDESASVDVDAAGVHEHLGSTDLVDTRSDDLIEDRHIETEFDEDNTATSTLTQHRTVENTVTERKTVLADITDVDIDDSTVVSEEVVATEIVDADTSAVTGRGFDDETETSTASAGRTETTDAGTTGTTGAGTTGTTGRASGTMNEDRTADVNADEDHPVSGDAGVSGNVRIDDSAMGRDVVTPDGEKIGMVSDVDAERDRLEVDEDPSLTDRLKAHLHWGDDDDTATLTPAQIREMNHDSVVVEGRDR